MVSKDASTKIRMPRALYEEKLARAR
jgi:hypothetical protein